MRDACRREHVAEGNRVPRLSKKSRKMCLTHLGKNRPRGVFPKRFPVLQSIAKAFPTIAKMDHLQHFTPSPSSDLEFGMMAA